MKRILLLILICTIISFTACADKTSTIESSSASETKAIEENIDNTTENTTDKELTDEEYLVNLGKQLELGMTVEDIIVKIGEPDAYVGSGILYLKYNCGNCSLNIMVGSPNGNADDIFVYNKETNQIINIY